MRDGRVVVGDRNHAGSLGLFLVGRRSDRYDLLGHLPVGVDLHIRAAGTADNDHHVIAVVVHGVTVRGVFGQPVVMRSLGDGAAERELGCIPVVLDGKVFDALHEVLEGAISELLQPERELLVTLVGGSIDRLMNDDLGRYGVAHRRLRERNDVVRRVQLRRGVGLQDGKLLAAVCVVHPVRAAVGLRVDQRYMVFQLHRVVRVDLGVDVEPEHVVDLLYVALVLGGGVGEPEHLVKCGLAVFRRDSRAERERPVLVLHLVERLAVEDQVGLSQLVHEVHVVGVAVAVVGPAAHAVDDVRAGPQEGQRVFSLLECGGRAFGGNFAVVAAVDGNRLARAEVVHERDAVVLVVARGHAEGVGMVVGLHGLVGQQRIVQRLVHGVGVLELLVVGNVGGSAGVVVVPLQVERHVVLVAVFVDHGFDLAEVSIPIPALGNRIAAAVPALVRSRPGQYAAVRVLVGDDHGSPVDCVAAVENMGSAVADEHQVLMVGLDARVLVEHLLAREDAGCDVGPGGLPLPVAWADVALQRGDPIVVEALEDLGRAIEGDDADPDVGHALLRNVHEVFELLLDLVVGGDGLVDDEDHVVRVILARNRQRHFRVEVLVQVRRRLRDGKRPLLGLSRERAHGGRVVGAAAARLALDGRRGDGAHGQLGRGGDVGRGQLVHAVCIGHEFDLDAVDSRAHRFDLVAGIGFDLEGERRALRDGDLRGGCGQDLVVVNDVGMVEGQRHISLGYLGRLEPGRPVRVGHGLPGKRRDRHLQEHEHKRRDHCHGA